LELELTHANATLDHAKALVAGLEAKASGRWRRECRIRLAETLQPLLNRLPQDSASLQGRRDRSGCRRWFRCSTRSTSSTTPFSITVSEKRKNDRGEEVAVESVYVGLGAAYFVNQTGDFAGAGRARRRTGGSGRSIPS
jgi:hypothetical protein